jgi:alpha-beta hydrolase superfamily lysophospholipase
VDNPLLRQTICYVARVTRGRAGCPHPVEKARCLGIWRFKQRPIPGSVSAVDTDVLGAPYERRTINLPSDDEGEVVATLVRRRVSQPTRRAVLFVHGFVDYFFQTHLAEFFTTRGYDFYALDLRKHGRSLLVHQRPNFCRDIAEYYAEIDEAVRIIREVDGHDVLLVNGHSTGGLTTSLWADRVRGKGVVQGLFLNSPFFDFNEPWLIRRGLAFLVNGFGKSRPTATMPQQLGTTYGLSLHRDHHGEWNYDLAWKPLNGYPIYAGWVRAISLAQQRLRAGLAIDVPVLVACSTRSYKGKTFTEAAHHADAVLDVEHIAKFAPRLGPDVTLVRIDGGKHDLSLSPKPARERFFEALDGWLVATPALDYRESAAH